MRTVKLARIEVREQEEKKREKPHEEEWFVISINSSKHDEVLRGIRKVAFNNAVEIQFYNPHYIPRKKRSQSDYGYGKAFTGSQMYDGYLYIYIYQDDLEYIESELKAVTGINRIMYPHITQQEFDDMFNVVMSMYQEYKTPTKEQVKNRNYQYQMNQSVKVVDGQLAGFTGRIIGLSKGGQMLKVAVKFLGTETNVTFPPQLVVPA